jgi:hypothetical protein
MEEDEAGRSGGLFAPGGKVRPFASNTCTVSRPGFSVVSEVGFVFELKLLEEEGADLSFPDEVA